MITLGTLQYNEENIDQIYNFMNRRIKTQVVIVIIILSDLWVSYISEDSKSIQKEINQCTLTAQSLAAGFQYTCLLSLIMMAYFFEQTSTSKFINSNLNIMGLFLLILMKVIMILWFVSIFTEVELLACEQVCLFVICLAMSSLMQVFFAIVTTKMDLTLTGLFWAIFLGISYTLVIISIGYISYIGVDGIQSVIQLISNVSSIGGSIFS